MRVSKASIPPLCTNPQTCSYFLCTTAFEITACKRLSISFPELRYTQQFLEVCNHRQLCRYVDILAKSMVLMLLFQVKLHCCWTLEWHHTSSIETCNVFILLFLCICPLGGTLSIFETPKQLHGLENITVASIHKVLSSTWEKYRFGVNYLFKE